ncbi:hypothetical protein ZIOFF_066894 [Zingiber officinale]|uniref:Uncharacterized protein n=1 Tax=Zingiber officinale TaxID=94328 RepID=A0A8J5EYS1_ZINOF|nr:hypothetical protein ZIOFF_066894 [Zingiber officinale]
MKRMQQLVDDAELRKKNSKLKEVPLPSSSVSSNMASKSSFSGPLQNDDPTPTKKRKGPLGSLEKAFNLNVRDELHFEIARLFYIGGLSFNIAKNPHYYIVRNNLLVPQAHRSHYAKWSLRKLTANEPTMPRSDLEASVGSDIREFLRWILAQMSRVHTKTMNMVLTANPITVMTRLSPGQIMIPPVLPLLLPSPYLIKGGMPIKAAPFPQNLPRFPDAISIRKSLKPKDGISDRNPTRSRLAMAFLSIRVAVVNSPSSVHHHSVLAQSFHIRC